MTRTADPAGAPVDALAVSGPPEDLRVAALARGRLVEITAGALSGTLDVGAILRGRVRRAEASRGLSFLDIGTDRPAVLDHGGGGAPGEGALLLVQVTAAPGPGKGPSVTRDVRLEGDLVVATARPGVSVSRRVPRTDAARLRRVARDRLARSGAGAGLILRHTLGAAGTDAIEAAVDQALARWRGLIDAAAAGPGLVSAAPDPVSRALAARGADAPGSVDVACDDPGTLAGLRGRLAGWPDVALALERPPGGLLARPDVAEGIEEGLARVVGLRAGARIVVETTAACVAVDVDAGGSTERPERIDGDAAVEVARQLRLRNLGGLIVVDFLRLADRPGRDAVAATLAAACAGDRLPVACHGWTRGGLFELTRPRDGQPLAALVGDRSAVEGSGR